MRAPAGKFPSSPPIRAGCQTRSVRRGQGLKVVAALAVALAAGGALGVPAAWAGGGSVEDCVRTRTGNGESRAEALVRCARSTDATAAATTAVPAGTSRGGSGDDGPSALVTGLAGALAGAALGFVVGAVVFRARRRAAAGPAPVPVPAPPPAVPAPGPAEAERALAAQRHALAVALIGIADRFDSDAVRNDVGHALADAGLRVYPVQAGEPFDPSRHRGVDAQPTTDPALDGRIARVERNGWIDGDTVLRVPDVVVNRLEAAP